MFDLFDLFGVMCHRGFNQSPMSMFHFNGPTWAKRCSSHIFDSVDSVDPLSLFCSQVLGGSSVGYGLNIVNQFISIVIGMVGMEHPVAQLMLYGGFHEGYPPVIHFRWGFSLTKTIQLLGVAWLWNPIAQFRWAPPAPLRQVIAAIACRIRRMTSRAKPAAACLSIYNRVFHCNPSISPTMDGSNGWFIMDDLRLPSGKLRVCYWTWP